MIGNIKPFWSLEDVIDLPYKLGDHQDESLIDKYVRYGHSAACMTLWNFFYTDNPLPDLCQRMHDTWTDLSKISIAINRLTPGQYLPMHHDLYQRYRRIHGLDKSTHIRRIIVMIEDSQPGQICQVGHTVYGRWLAGDWFDWIDETPHAVYNFSLQDRYAWQITGVLV
jgi:hypothetical protein